MGAFAAEDLLGQAKGPDDLYDGSPTLMVYLSPVTEPSVTAGDALYLGRTNLENAGVSHVIMTTMSVASNANWAADNNYTALDIWSDQDREILDYYDKEAGVPAPPSALLFDKQGFLTLVYDRVDIPDDFTEDVAADVELLWGAR